MGKKKDKVTHLPSVNPVEYDPRANMTEEEIRQFMLQEEEELSQRLSKFLVTNPQPTSDAVEEDQEVESYKVDLEKKTVEQTIMEPVLVEGGYVKELIGDVVSEKIPQFTIQNPYFEIVGQVFVRKAIVGIIKKYRDAEFAVTDLMWKVPSDTRASLEAEAQRIEGKINELRSSLVGSEWDRYGPTGVKFDKIPEWAVDEIKSRINESLNELLGLTEISK